MAVIEGATTGALAEVDPLFDAMRVSLRPMEANGWLSIAAMSGAVTAIAANAAVFSFRNISANPVAVRRVGLGFICTTGFTAAQQLNWGLKVARAFTASDTVGTAIALVANNGKLRTSHNTFTSVDCRISAAAALGAGTKVLDTNDLGIAGAYAPAATAGVLLAPQSSNLLSHDAGDHPLILAQNEGFNIMNLTLMGAVGVGTLYVNLELAEVVTY